MAVIAEFPFRASGMEMSATSAERRPIRVLRCHHTDSFFVKIDNPQEVFIFDN